MDTYLRQRNNFVGSTSKKLNELRTTFLPNLVHFAVETFVLEQKTVEIIWTHLEVVNLIKVWRVKNTPYLTK